VALAAHRALDVGHERHGAPRPGAGAQCAFSFSALLAATTFSAVGPGTSS
jgi:hypothetical protein